MFVRYPLQPFVLENAAAQYSLLPQRSLKVRTIGMLRQRTAANERGGGNGAGFMNEHQPGLLFNPTPWHVPQVPAASRLFSMSTHLTFPNPQLCGPGAMEGGDAPLLCPFTAPSGSSLDLFYTPPRPSSHPSFPHSAPDPTAPSYSAAPLHSPAGQVTGP